MNIGDDNLLFLYFVIPYFLRFYNMNAKGEFEYC